MSETSRTTSWMWNDDGEVNGLRLDLDDRLLLWFDGIGCACGDSTAEQPFVDFLDGNLLGFNPPDDVLAEVQAVVRRFA